MMLKWFLLDSRNPVLINWQSQNGSVGQLKDCSEELHLKTVRPYVSVPELCSILTGHGVDGVGPSSREEQEATSG